MTKKRATVKSDFTKGLEQLMNNPTLSPFSSPHAYDQMRNASSLPLSAMMSYIGNGKRNTKKEDADRSKQRIEKLEAE